MEVEILAKKDQWMLRMNWKEFDEKLCRERWVDV
jgi:hypothetical protein